MVLTIINIIALISLAVGYFRGNYTIVNLETWNKVAHFYNEYSDGEGGIEVPEQAGGEGQRRAHGRDRRLYVFAHFLALP